MASYKDILEIANKRIDSGDIPDESVIFDIDSLGAWLKFLNVWLLPVLLTLAVAGIVWWRRRRARNAAA